MKKSAKARTNEGRQGMIYENQRAKHLEKALAAGFKDTEDAILTMVGDQDLYPDKGKIMKSLGCGIGWWERYLCEMEEKGIEIPKRLMGYDIGKKKNTHGSYAKNRSCKPQKPYFIASELDYPEVELFGDVYAFRGMRR